MLTTSTIHKCISIHVIYTKKNCNALKYVTLFSFINDNICAPFVLQKNYANCKLKSIYNNEKYPVLNKNELLIRSTTYKYFNR